MATIFVFDEDRYDVSYLCPHALTHFKILRGDRWLEFKFPFFTIIKAEGRSVLFSCMSCHTESSDIFNFHEHPGDFARCFQRYFPDENDLM